LSFGRAVADALPRNLVTRLLPEGRSGKKKAGTQGLREVAQRLGVSTATVYNLCASGALVHQRILNLIRVPVGAVASVSRSPRTT